ncbi:outer membrane receptor protein involved in Fe transport [Anseongella ginsenosidimutans]|uniref:Outer membrane receptor protein involved in Fe transport n=1 Tax=Anseongella ginsenosidimutans TaxID=496056 RepID=A0A4R3KNV2_9SPHI|nr:TonB-dependent receptor [Anseongella ginsenosidimutans]QEC53762.1 TonB-dependent receptor [Anseongella ginsenosidimutans]TCS85977.1 outer membrane receptor protein involved in Fe transport [Anseongella ginsenosidimutans]
MTAKTPFRKLLFNSMLLLLLLIAVTPSYSQQTGSAASPGLSGKTGTVSVTGKITSESGNPIAFVNIALLKAGDSSLVTGTVSDSTGIFLLENLASGKYIIKASFLGYESAFSGPFQAGGAAPAHNAGTLVMKQDTGLLQSVTVTGQKPLIEQKLDRTVLNVENSILAQGNTALEVLEKAPGVMVDNDGNISLKGKPGVLIMIDGKPTYLSQQQVSTMLQSMSSNNIARVEIITNPSAKYEAAGNSGIINIVLKKNKNAGVNGSANASFSQGKKYRADGGLNLNYRNKKLNIFGNYSYGQRMGDRQLDISRNFFVSGSDIIDRSFLQEAHMKMPSHNHSVKGGVDYYLDEKNTIGVMLSGNIGEWESDNPTLSSILHPDESLHSGSRSLNVTSNHWNNLTYNFNYKHMFDSAGKELTADMDYSRSDYGSDQNFHTDFFDAAGETVSQASVRRGSLPSLTDIYAGKIDYVHPFKNGIKLETGWKSSFVTTDNNVRYDSLAGNNWVVDHATTNHFTYRENINAGYLNFSKDFKGFSLQIGLRGEQTITEGHQVTTDSLVKRNYFQLFPSVFLRKELNKNHQLQLSYSRRVNRPDYESLNPFRYYIDPYTYEEGNPYLEPQTTHSMEFSHVFKGKFTTTVNFSHTDDVMTEVARQIDSTNTTYVTRENLSTQNNYGLSITAPVPITSWWMSNNYFNIFYNQYKGEYLGDFVNTGLASFNFNSQNTFTLKNGFSLELSGFYNSKAVYGLLIAQPMYMVSAGIQKTVLDKKGTIKFNVSDVFNTRRFRGDIRYQNMDIGIRNTWDSRMGTLSFSYRFGKEDIKPARRRNTGSEAEQNRIRGGGN